jgi:hypothetical protein
MSPWLLQLVLSEYSSYVEPFFHKYIIQYIIHFGGLFKVLFLGISLGGTRCFFSIYIFGGWYSQNGKFLEEDLAKFGYRPDYMKVILK